MGGPAVTRPLAARAKQSTCWIVELDNRLVNMAAKAKMPRFAEEQHVISWFEET
jgi:hypothetical protein